MTYSNSIHFSAQENELIDFFWVNSGDGFKVIYQVALTILKLNEERILQAEDSIGAFQVLQNMPRRMIDCDKFIKVWFEGKAGLT